MERFRKIFLTVLVVALLFAAFFSLSINQISWAGIIKSDSKIRYSQKNWEFEASKALQSQINEYKNQKLEVLREKELEAELQRRASDVRSLFERYNSPMIGYEYLIVSRAYECGGDYKLLVAIAGNESGFGRVPYKLYNPFGYLDGVQYSGWEESLNYLSCKISEQHLAPCNNNVACVVESYGGSDTNKPKWISNITWFMNQL